MKQNAQMADLDRLGSLQTDLPPSSDLDCGGSKRKPSWYHLPSADVAQLVERNLAKVEVAGSIPVVRSLEGGHPTALFRRRGRVVRQGSAKP